MIERLHAEEPKMVSRLASMVRQRRGSMSVRDAAKSAEISHATLSRVENGGTPDLHTFAKLCEWLRVDPADLLGIRNGEHLR